MKTKLVDFGVFIHVGFILGHSDTKAVVGHLISPPFSHAISLELV